MATYKITVDGNIQCLVCMYTSHNRGDIENKYCGYCHAFHSELEKVFANQEALEAFRNPDCSLRSCAKCSRQYRGAGVYCSMRCAVS